MRTLNTLQKEFQAYLLSPASLPAIEPAIINTPEANAGLRLEIYAEAYRLRLQEALRTDFEAVHGLLGDEQFDDLCLRYIDRYPSRHFSLRYFGRQMSAYLRDTEPYARQPVLSELAAFEWALIDAFDAPDCITVTREDMAELTAEAWPALQFEMHDSIQQLRLSWNVQAIWKALKEGGEPPLPVKTNEAHDWLIWRHDMSSYFRPLAPYEAWAINAARNGCSFAALCEGLCEWVGEEQAAVSAAGLLHLWVRDGLIKRWAGSAV